jgi:hypothetical protein
MGGGTQRTGKSSFVAPLAAIFPLMVYVILSVGAEINTLELCLHTL